MSEGGIRARIFALLLCFLACFLANAACASVNDELSNEYLMNQFDWTLYLDVRDLPAYLNYRGTSLNPLTRVRVYFRKFLRSANGASGETIATYEDFWYRQGQVLGMKRLMPLKLSDNESGCIMVGPAKSSVSDSGAAADSVVRLIADLYLKNAVAGTVFVPAGEYDAFTSSLGRYHFSPQIKMSEGTQMSIHLQAYPNGSDEYLYLRK